MYTECAAKQCLAHRDIAKCAVDFLRENYPYYLLFPPCQARTPALRNLHVKQTACRFSGTISTLLTLQYTRHNVLDTGECLAGSTGFVPIGLQQ